MTLPRLDAIVKHWEAVPPLSVNLAAIASVLGVGRAAPSRPVAPALDADGKLKTIEPDEEKTRALFDMLGGAGGFTTDNRPDWLKSQM